MTQQVIRNNIARTLAANLDVEPNLAWGVDEYFEMWGDGAFPWVDGGNFTLHRNGALNKDERQALLPLVDALNAAWAETDGMSADEFLSTAWPSRISQLAGTAHSVMLARGCFSETDEELEPSDDF
ncbi:hypothetical protein [Parasphingopyxis marina]|uniref:Uncharacterized protein n=1 Tax=Parasphingopyxis marina TaxID=2761622 RepID=A0A842HWC9_9SPHN|nr:hypothetical protein [Parasphingopyxis marina]MBC2776727.1 hypothetical protein [Parasphingopyxis marina]